MAYVQNDYPLYYDAINEKGLGVAGLNFVGNAVYQPAAQDLDNIAQFELIPWLLGQCATLAQARVLLERMNLFNEPFHPSLPLAQLHWLIADKTGCITVEATHDGLHIYDNPTGVLTNNPPFPMQLFNLNNYMALSAKSPENTFAPDVPLATYSRGMGRDGASGRPVLAVALCPRGVCPCAFALQADRRKQRQSVLPYPPFRRAAARLL